MHYSDLLELDDLLNPTDDLLEAIYSNTKLDFLLRGANIKEVAARNNASTGNNESSADEGDLLEEETALIKTEDKEVQNRFKVPTNSIKKVLVGAHEGWVRSLTVDPVSNEWFVSGGGDSKIKIWDLASGSLKASLDGHIMAVRALTVSKRYPYLFSGAEDKTVRCWDLERTNSPAGCQIRDYHGHVGGIYAIDLHPELDLLFTGGRDAVVRVWDIRSRTQVMVLTGHRGDVSSIVSQVGDPQVCSSSMDGTVRLWDLRKQKTHLILTQHSKSVRLLVMHPHEMTMASCDSTGRIREWLLPGGELLSEFGKTGMDAMSPVINTMAINPTSNELFAGHADGKMAFYDYESGQELSTVLQNPVPGNDTCTIYTSAYDMLGLRLITGLSDKSIKIWSTEDS